MLIVKIGSWTRDLCLGDPISLPLHHEVTHLMFRCLSKNSNNNPLDFLRKIFMCFPFGQMITVILQSGASKEGFPKKRMTNHLDNSDDEFFSRFRTQDFYKFKINYQQGMWQLLYLQGECQLVFNIQESKNCLIGKGTSINYPLIFQILDKYFEYKFLEFNVFHGHLPTFALSKMLRYLWASPYSLKILGMSGNARKFGKESAGCRSGGKKFIGHTRQLYWEFKDTFR